MSVADKLLTWEDIKDLPESHGRTEIVDGEFVVSPTPGSRHQVICYRLALKLGPYVTEQHLGTLFSHPIHVILAEHVHYEPDLSFIARARGSIIQESYIDGPPDLVIEVISESNRTHDTVVKHRDYAVYGVAEYWLVDMREEVISTWGLRDQAYALLGRAPRGKLVTTNVLEGLKLDPADAFDDPFEA
jgi:Uma2 family endonuclease